MFIDLPTAIAAFERKTGARAVSEEGAPA